MKHSLKKTILALLTFCSTVSAFAQDQITLGAGDPAPAIKYSKWLKGKPVDSYKDDHLYVLEFWATWCGPCIAAMPHLSELSEKYKGKATFIGVNVWEKNGEEPYETTLPAVEKFVKNSAKRMRYDVVVDNNAQDMVNLWLKPAGILGIPTTFIVKQGKIVWIGHPIELDTLMDPIISGTYDFAAFTKRYKDKKSAAAKGNNEIKQFLDSVKLATDAKDYQKALQLLDEGSKNKGPIGLMSRLRKFSLLLEHFTEAEAMNYGKEVIKENPGFATAAGHTIVEKDGLSKESYLFAAETFKTALETNKYSAMYDKMALCYFKAGDISLAIEAETKAVEQAKIEVKDPKFEGYVFEDTIAGYEETLKKYKKAQK